MKGDKHGMKVVLTLSVSIEQAFALKKLAEDRKTTVQQLFRDWVNSQVPSSASLDDSQ